MGCGHSKINIYKKYKNKANSKNLVIHHEVGPKEENEKELELESPQKIDESDLKRTVKIKSFGGSLLAQAEISTSQQDFFKMLDEKIQNGPDYNSDSESERLAETRRLKTLLKDWESVSSGSRSQSLTPNKKLDEVQSTKCSNETGAKFDIARNSSAGEIIHKSPINQSIVQRSYGIPQPAYLQSPYENFNCFTNNPTPYAMPYQPTHQFQGITPTYSSNNSSEQHPQSSTYPVRQYPSYNQYGSPIKTYVSSPSKHIGYEPSAATYSPTHRLYGPFITVPCNKEKSEKEIDYNSYYVGSDIAQQHQQSPPQLYNYHPNQHRHFKEAREQVLTPQQQNSYRGLPNSYHSSANNGLHLKERHDMNSLRKRQYELT